MFSRDNKAREKILDLEERFQKLERDLHALQMEWENAYDKIRTMMGRISKRAEVLQKEMDGGKPELSPEEIAIRDNMGDAARQGGLLSPRQKLIQQQILRRRANMQ